MHNDKELYDTLLAKQLDLRERDTAMRLTQWQTPRSVPAALNLDDLSRRLSIPRDWLARLLPSVDHLQRTSDRRYWIRLPWHDPDSNAKRDSHLQPLSPDPPPTTASDATDP